jgi:hypothetical protein
VSGKKSPGYRVPRVIGNQATKMKNYVIKEKKIRSNTLNAYFAMRLRKTRLEK